MKRPSTSTSKSSNYSTIESFQQVTKIMKYLEDTNVFYRSKACRDVIDMVEEGRLDRETHGKTWELIAEALVKIFPKEEDEDVKRFAGEALRLMEVERNEMGEFEVLRSQPPAKVEATGFRKSTKQVIATVSKFMDGQPVFRQHNAWRAALTRSIRENRTWEGSRKLELISFRENGTMMNRVINFRGFVPDTPGEKKDRLYFVTDSRIEKAEQASMDADAIVQWRFKLTKERYQIKGKVKTIRSFKGVKKFHEYEEKKFEEAEEDPSLLHYRRIAWNSCSFEERSELMFPKDLPILETKQIDNLMRTLMQGLCIHPLTHEIQFPSAAFEKLDKEGSGTMTYEEFGNGLKEAYIFMAEQDRQTIWDFLDRDGAGEIEYSKLNDFISSTEVPENFWIKYIEPDEVERTGSGDPWGKNEGDDDTVNTWVYFLDEQGGWIFGPKLSQDEERPDT